MSQKHIRQGIGTALFQHLVSCEIWKIIIEVGYNRLRKMLCVAKSVGGPSCSRRSCSKRKVCTCIHQSYNTKTAIPFVCSGSISLTANQRAVHRKNNSILLSQLNGLLVGHGLLRKISSYRYAILYYKCVPVIVDRASYTHSPLTNGLQGE